MEKDSERHRENCKLVGTMKNSKHERTLERTTALESQRLRETATQEKLRPSGRG